MSDFKPGYGYGPNRVLVSGVESAHWMDDEPCRGKWLLLEFPDGGRAYTCPVCHVGIHESAPTMFARLEAARELEVMLSREEGDKNA